MKVLGISASPRVNGNSHTLLDRALCSAGQAGAKSEMISLSRLEINPCRGDDSCLADGRCRIKDDMPALIKKIDSCDRLIIASPVYFGSITAQLKTMIDRCQQAWVKKYLLGKKACRDRRGAFICVSKYENRNFFRNSKEIVEVLFRVLDIKLAQTLWCFGLEAGDSAANNEACLQKAYKLGRKIINL
ncbi:MAG: flavodoxin family protein [Candidatus Omnitrophica bacterium]|jgi:multimeric flavodoxin WrbA|nr:flavodoxin family protein [Candidatus Omnitrophota bacterium]